VVDGTPNRVIVDDPNDVGSRADAVLARRVPALSRKIVRELARAGRLHIDGKRARGSTPVSLGMRLEIVGPTRPEATLPPLHVLRETDDYVFVDKPAGVHTVRLRPDDPSTLADAVAERFPECATASEDPRESGALHRLDGETTGVVAFARSPAAWTVGRAKIRIGARKFYLAICNGEPDPWPPDVAGVWRVDDAQGFPEADIVGVLPFATEPRPTGVSVTAALRGEGLGGAAVRVDPRGEPAVSRCWPLHTTTTPDGPVTWVCARLMTGRRHQARVHLALLSLPVVGDARYGTAPQGGRLLLHAWALDLGLPAAGPGPVLAPLPSEFLRLA
jgi:23S rRNA pseudouridine1911/1915/1917 synthase